MTYLADNLENMLVVSGGKLMTLRQHIASIRWAVYQAAADRAHAVAETHPAETRGAALEIERQLRGLAEETWSF